MRAEHTLGVGFHFDFQVTVVRARQYLFTIGDTAANRPAFLPWCRQYLNRTGDVPYQDWATMLLYDFRHSAVNCGLHECRPATCHKGKLGKAGFCRLGYWHWEPVENEDFTWVRLHGHDITEEPTIGIIPPHAGQLITERHHPFFARLNPAILCCCKCNHDIRVILSLPPDNSTGNADAITDSMLRQMVARTSAATYYITDYSGKVQPHSKNLFALKHHGLTGLADEMRSTTEAGLLKPAYLQQRTLMRMATACHKRVHKSMQEMVAYLLQQPEAYCSHYFRLLFYTNLVHLATTSGPSTDSFGMPPREVPQDHIATLHPLLPHNDTEASVHDAHPTLDDPNGSAGTAKPPLAETTPQQATPEVTAGLRFSTPVPNPQREAG